MRMRQGERKLKIDRSREMKKKTVRKRMSEERVKKISENRFGEQGNRPNGKTEKRVESSYIGNGKFQDIFPATHCIFSNCAGA